MNKVNVKHIMTHSVATLSPDESVHDAVAKFVSNRISGAPVVENGKVVGMLTESDILNCVAPAFPQHRRSIIETVLNPGNAHPVHRPEPLVGDVMTGLITFHVSPEASLWEAASLLHTKGVKRLPVIDSNDRLVGIVSRADILRAIARPDEEIRTDLLETLVILGTDALVDLEVTVEDGVATLRGRAATKRIQKMAAKLGCKVPGVIHLVDHFSHGTDDIDLQIGLDDVESLSPFNTIRKAGAR